VKLDWPERSRKRNRQRSAKKSKVNRGKNGKRNKLTTEDSDREKTRTRPQRGGGQGRGTIKVRKKMEKTSLQMWDASSPSSMVIWGFPNVGEGATLEKMPKTAILRISMKGERAQRSR